MNWEDIVSVWVERAKALLLCVILWHLISRGIAERNSARRIAFFTLANWVFLGIIFFAFTNFSERFIRDYTGFSSAYGIALLIVPSLIFTVEALLRQTKSRARRRDTGSFSQSALYRYGVKVDSSNSIPGLGILVDDVRHGNKKGAAGTQEPIQSEATCVSNESYAVD